ncbi:unnamed protein product [Rhodiola kirilowii]
MLLALCVGSLFSGLLRPRRFLVICGARSITGLEAIRSAYDISPNSNSKWDNLLVLILIYGSRLSVPRLPSPAFLHHQDPGTELGFKSRSRNSKARILRTRLHRSLFRLPTPPPVPLIFGDLYVVLCVVIRACLPPAVTQPPTQPDEPNKSKYPSSWKTSCLIETLLDVLSLKTFAGNASNPKENNQPLTLSVYNNILMTWQVVIGCDTYLAFYRFRVNQNPNRCALASAGTISLSSSIRRFPIRLEQFWDMAAAQSLFNGERAVVVLFVSRIMLCADSSILYESLALVMLALYALAVEICAEAPGRVSSLKTRPGASCGVLLGAITLPAVLASKLIQQSRGYLLREIELEEFEYFKLQYWATFSCCFSVLSFVAFDSKDSSTSQKSLKQNCWDVKLRFICLVFFTGLGSLSLVTTHGWGLPASVKLVYVVCQGLAAVKVVQHIIYTFPSCASIGEALLVTSGLVHCFGDMVACTVAEVSFIYLYNLMIVRLISPGLVSAQFGINRSEISIIIQEPYLGYLSFQTCSRLSSKYGAYFVQEFSLHPILWIVRFVFSEPLKRLSLCFYWVSLICVAVLRFYSNSKHSKVERILLRKYYHLMAVCMFLPAVIYQPMFLDLAFGAALAVFLVLEIIRIWKMWPLGQLVHQFMTAFTDHRDSDILIVSHFSLLLGCALPIWVSSGYNDRPLAPFAGILSLGIGDNGETAFASMVGYKYGVLRWSKAGKKTIEGTAAGITSMLAACLTLLPLLASTGYLVTENWFPLLFAVTVSGLLEAYTAQLDNAFIPLVFYSLLCL